MLLCISIFSSFQYNLFLKLILHDSFKNIKYNLCIFYNSHIDDYKYFK